MYNERTTAAMMMGGGGRGVGCGGQGGARITCTISNDNNVPLFHTRKACHDEIVPVKR